MPFETGTETRRGHTLDLRILSAEVKNGNFQFFDPHA
jgi:hypothetical protein